MAGNKTKLCYILPFYEEGTDTHLFYNYELIKQAAQSVDISLIIEKCPKLSLGQIKDELGVSSCYIQKFKFPPLRFLEIFWQCIRMMKNGYHNFYVHYSHYGALAAFFAGGKVFYWNRGMPWLFRRGWFAERVFRFILKNTILATGPESLAKEYVHRYGVRKYRVLSNWVDITRFFAPQHQISQEFPQKLEEKTKAFQDFSQRDGARLSNPAAAGYAGLEKLSATTRIVLFVHHLSKRKGADLIPEIAKGFGDDVLFLAAGDGPERENLENCGLSNVKVLGKIPNSEIPRLFSIADIFLMPSREEGSPHVILEAMASGTPFVASDVGGVKEIVPEALEGGLCAPEDVRCFQDKIKALLSDKTLYNKAKEECLSYAKNFDISRGVEEFINLFK